MARPDRQQIVALRVSNAEHAAIHAMADRRDEPLALTVRRVLKAAIRDEERELATPAPTAA